MNGERLLNGKRGNKEDKIKKAHLTLKMESLLVHSDGECAVVFVIYANHSSLDKKRPRVTRHTPLSISTLMSSTQIYSPNWSFSVNYSQQSQQITKSPSHNLRMFSSNIHTSKCTHVECGEKKENGRGGGGGIWESKGGENTVKGGERPTLGTGS